MEGYLKPQCLPKKIPHGALIKKAAIRQHTSLLSIVYLKNMDQMKYGSFIKKMAEDFATGWENVYLIHIEDVQHILSIHKYDQADHNNGHMSSKNDDHSTTGNVPNIVEMSFAQMDGHCYKCGTKGHLK